MKQNCFVGSFLVIFALFAFNGMGWGEDQTFAERLGWREGSKVVIFHIDDAGMCHDANLGTIEALEEGVATSASIMMPCSWVPEFVDYVNENPEVDAGLHLTLTSEWDKYRWGPLAGKAAVPGLVDDEGCMWDSVEEVVEHASPTEVQKEIAAQLRRAKKMGLKPTHLDSHMGTLFFPTFIPVYVQLGIDSGIPILLPGGHLQYVSESEEVAAMADMVRELAEKVWDAGLPVIDDVVSDTYDWKSFEEKKSKVIGVLRDMKPGVTEIVVHCTRPTDLFEHISSSGDNRVNDLRVVKDKDVQKVIEEERIVLTTWRELKERRDKVQ